MKILPLIITSAVLLYSCDAKNSSTKQTEKTTVAESESTAPSDTANLAKSAEINSEVEGNTSSGVRPALNPAHGEPYHRCDISVGAPIDSAPQQNAAPQNLTQQGNTGGNFNTSPIAPSIAAPISSPQATGPKPALNPAHGEPHHRCDLQVGAPLT